MHTISRFSRIAGLTLASVLTAALLLSCEEKEPVPVTINSQPSQIAAEGGSTSFTVTAPGTWTAAVQPASDGTAAAWLTIDPASGEAGEHRRAVVHQKSGVDADRENRHAGRAGGLIDFRRRRFVERPGVEELLAGGERTSSRHDSFLDGIYYRHRITGARGYAVRAARPGP